MVYIPKGLIGMERSSFLVKENVDVEVKMNTEQHITLKLVLLEENMHMNSTLVNVKYEVGENFLLWNLLTN